MPTARLLCAAALAIACQQAAAQSVVAPALEVQRLAPQLVAFAGSPANFQNLVAGLSQGTPVQLFTTLPDGSTQAVTFTPAAALSPVEIAQALEATRQRLIGLGIGAPTAEQLALALTGGTVPTPLSASSGPQIQSGQSGVSVQLFPPAASGGAAAGATAPGAAPRLNTSDSPIPAGATSRSPAAPGPVITPPRVQAAPEGAAPNFEAPNRR